MKGKEIRERRVKEDIDDVARTMVREGTKQRIWERKSKTKLSNKRKQTYT